MRRPVGLSPESSEKIEGLTKKQTEVIVNEVLAHTDAAPNDMIELYNEGTNRSYEHFPSYNI